MELHPLVWADRQPDKPAWIYQDQSVTYQQLADYAIQGANLFRRLGFKPGDGIAVVAENHLDTMLVFWASQLAGLFYTPISVQFQAGEIAYILADCDARLLISSHAQQAQVVNAPQPIQIDLQTWRDAISGESRTLAHAPLEGAEMLYSSGTTGHPKGVRAVQPGAPAGTVSDLFKKRLALHSMTDDTVYLSPAPLYHSAPLRYNNMTSRVGGTSVIMERFDAQRSLELIEQYKVTHSQWVPTMFVRLLKLPQQTRQAYDLASHRVAIHAAAPCPQEIKRQMLAWWGPIVHEYYSGTEGNGQTAIGPDEWLKHPGSVGKPILGTLHITGEDGNDLPAGQEGHVYFSGGPRFEYYKDQAKTAGAYNQHGWSTLGDIGRVDEEGYLYLTDRASHMIITGGVNVYPREIEDVLVIHPQVADAAVFGIPDAEFGEQVKAAVSLVKDADVSEADLIEWCRQRLAHLKCPRSVDFHESLPRHQTGKLYKQKLKAPYWKDPTTVP
ncbi:MAG: AMP-binding protein [Proteobacteria bacterium]|nr:AMP-binding protein [Pseudomonadota bacterium]